MRSPTGRDNGLKIRPVRVRIPPRLPHNKKLMRYIKNILSLDDADDIAALDLLDYEGYWMRKTEAPSNIAERYINSFIDKFLPDEEYEGIQYWLSVEDRPRNLPDRIHFDTYNNGYEIIKPKFTVTTYLTNSDNPTVALDINHYGVNDLDFDKERFPKSYWAKAIKGNAAIYKGNKLHLIYGDIARKKRVNLCFSLWESEPKRHGYIKPHDEGHIKLCNYEEIPPHRISGDALLELTYCPANNDGFLNLENLECNKKYSFFITEPFSDHEFVVALSS